MSTSWLSRNISIVNKSSINIVLLATLQCFIACYAHAAVDTDFESGFGDWQNTGSYDWLRKSGATSSSNTGPASASQGSYYAYMETSSGYAYSNGNTAILESGPINFTGSQTISFKYHMYGSEMGQLSLQVYSYGEWRSVWTKTGQQHSSTSSAWSSAVVSLSSFSGSGKLRFTGRAAGGYQGDMAIDNIQLYDPAAVPVYSGNMWSNGVNPPADATNDPDYYGFLEGSYSVGNDGSFNYSISVPVAPGLNGMQPNLALVYNTNSGNGILGLGWNLMGISKIHHCDADFRRDGYKQRLEAYCIDGARLYKTAANEYRTEEESTNIFTPTMDMFVGITEWEYIDASGTTYTYSGRENGDGSANINWHITRVEDLYGNYMLYEYEKGKTNGYNYHRPSKIRYHLNSAISTKEWVLKFNYSTRNDAVASGGYAVDNPTSMTFDRLTLESKRLTGIELIDGTSVAQKLNLRYWDQYSSYTDPAKRSLLRYLELCTPSGKCQAPLEFKWKDVARSEASYEKTYTTALTKLYSGMSSASLIFDKDTDGDFDGYYGPDDNQQVTYNVYDSYDGSFSHQKTISPESEYFSLDVNNDGYSDVVRVNATTVGVQVFLNNEGTISSTASSTFSVAKSSVSFNARREYKNHYFRECHTCGQQPGWTYKHYDISGLFGYSIKFADWNNDGLVDLLRIPPGCNAQTMTCEYDSSSYPKTISVLLNTGSGWKKSGSSLSFQTLYSNWDLAQQKADIQFVDIDEDGYLDIVASARYPRSFGPGTPDSSLQAVIYSLLSRNKGAYLELVSQEIGDPRFYGDFDGDGRRDIAIIPENYKDSPTYGGPFDMDDEDPLYVKLYGQNSAVQVTGDAHFLAACSKGAESTARCRMQVIDINSDGLDDIVQSATCLNAGDVERVYTPFGNNDEVFESISRCNTQMQTEHGAVYVEQVWLSKGLDANGVLNFSEPLIMRKDSTTPSSVKWNRLGEYVDINGDGLLENDEYYPTKLKPQIITSVKSASKQVNVSYQGLEMSSWLRKASGVFSGDAVLKDIFDTNDGYTSNAPRGETVSRQGVSQLQIVNSAASIKWIDYSYRGGVFDSASYGHMGYRVLEQKEKYSGDYGYTRTVSEYHQKAPQNNTNLSRKLKRSRVYVSETGNISDEVLISDKKYHWAVRVNNDGANAENKRWRAYVEKSSARTFELDGTPISTLNTYVGGSQELSCNPLTDSVSDSISMYSAGSNSDDVYSAEGVVYEEYKVVCDEYIADVDAPNAMVQAIRVNNGDIANYGDQKGLIGRVTTQRWTGRRALFNGSEVKSTSDINVKVNEVEYDYDVTDGRLISTIRQPNGSSNEKLTKTYAYSNVTGLPSTTTESWTNETGDSSLAFTSRTTTTIETFNAAGEREVVSTNGAGHLTKVTYNRLNGAARKTIDANNLVTENYYDDFGRLVRTDHANGTSTVLAYKLGCLEGTRHCMYPFDTFENYYVDTKTTGAASSRKYYEHQGRLVGVRSHGLDGSFIYTLSQYDERGRLAQTTAPFYSGETQQTTEFSYDYLDRKITTEFPSDETATIEYKGAKTILTNVLGQKQTRYTSAGGLVMRNIDNIGTPVDFSYDSAGNLVSTEVGGGSNPETHVSILYDDLGRKTELNDPNTGRITYVYNALGLLSEQRDAKNQVTKFKYDKLGRIVQRVDDATGQALTQSWAYDSQLKGLVDSLSGRSTNNQTYTENYSYNEWGQPAQNTASFEGKTFSVTTHYDTYGRPKGTTYPGGYAVANIYNSWGAIEKVVENTQQQVLWQATLADAMGRVVNATYGDSSRVERVYTPETGRIKRIMSTRFGEKEIDLSFRFDALGNLRARDASGFAWPGWTIGESFCYDDLNRLVSNAKMNACQAKHAEYAYDTLGNITYKKDSTDSVHPSTTYGYGNNAGPNAVTSANGLTFKYDANGNMIRALYSNNTEERSISYSAFNKPVSIKRKGYQTDIVYGAGQNRIKRIDKKQNSTTRTSFYFGKLYEEITESGVTRKIYYIGDFAQRVEEGGITPTAYHEFYHKDHLGSVILKTSDRDPASTVTAFNAWGLRQNHWMSSVFSDPDYEDSSALGFTGHEHLDPVGLIHMNGRVYDPELGRFLSPDPMVQAPYNTQNYNRYSYVLNNPLSLVDPTGYCYSDFEILTDLYMDEIEAGRNLGPYLLEKQRELFAQVRARTSGEEIYKITVNYDEVEDADLPIVQAAMDKFAARNSEAAMLRDVYKLAGGDLAMADEAVRAQEGQLTDQEKISSDIDKIQNKFDETVQEMNEKGLRYSGSPTKGSNSGRINNILSSTVCPNYKGCGEQALYLLEELNTSEFNSSLETPWFKDLIYEWGTWEHIAPHQYLILTPGLDRSIKFKLDPWANTTEIRHE